MTQPNRRRRALGNASLTLALSLSTLFAGAARDARATSVPPAARAALASPDPRTALGDAGLTPDELRQKLRDAGQSDAAIEAMLSSAPATSRHATATPVRTEPAIPTDSLARVNPASPDAAEPFGFEIFHWAPTTFEPLSYGPVDADYPLGPGDELALTLWGDDQLALSLPVSREGLVTLPDVGQVAVAGLTLEEARARVRASLARVYSGLRPAGQHSTTFVSLSLGKLRNIQVFLLGSVVRPGSYTLSSVSRMLNALYAGGGPTREGSLRDVRLLRGGRPVASVDLYDVILGGRVGGGAMPRLENGDVVFVPPAERRVNVTGPVRRPGLYELRAAEQLAALLKLAGGVLGDADLARAQVERIVPPALRDSLPGQGRMAIDVPLAALLADSTHDVALADADSLTLFPLPDRRANVVLIEGRGVARPGTYEFRAGMRVSDLVAAAGGLKPDAYLDRGLLTRTLPDSSRAMLRFSPRQALAGEAAENLELKAMDDVAIRSAWDLKERQPVTVLGLVRDPGQYELLEGMTLADLLMRAGGLTDDAFAFRAEIARLSSGERIADTLEVPIDRDLVRSPAATAMVLMPHDAVFIRRDPTYTEQEYVAVTGEVRFPGTYSLTRRDERVSDLIARAGGFTPVAYARGATFRRLGGARLAIDLPEAMRHPHDHNNLVLARGDTIEVPRFMPTVQIEGAVLSPLTALYQQGAGVGYYVMQASGYRPDADRHGVVVISPSGRVRRGGAPEPGSRIVVPARPADTNKDHLKDFATLMSVLASAATTYFLVRQGTK